MGHEALDLVFACYFCPPIYFWPVAKAKQWLCINQTPDWRLDILLYRKSERVSVLPGELTDLTLVEVNSMLTRYNLPNLCSATQQRDSYNRSTGSLSLWTRNVDLCGHILNPPRSNWRTLAIFACTQNWQHSHLFFFTFRSIKKYNN